MTKAELEQVWSAYLKSYSDVSEQERETLLRQTVSDDIVATNPADESRGFDQFLAHVTGFQKRMPGAYFKSDKLKFHHEQLLSEWTLYKADGTALTTAHTYGRLNEQGKLQFLIGFF